MGGSLHISRRILIEIGGLMDVHVRVVADKPVTGRQMAESRVERVAQLQLEIRNE
jgi:hypothetical protein